MPAKAKKVDYTSTLMILWKGTQVHIMVVSEKTKWSLDLHHCKAVPFPPVPVMAPGKQ